MPEDKTGGRPARRRRIALVAHDNMNSELVEWATFNRALLAEHDLCATGTTGALLAKALKRPVTLAS